MKRASVRAMVMACAAACAALGPAANRAGWAAEGFAGHPAAAELERVFAAQGKADVKPTGLTRADYLPLIAGNVDFFKVHQRGDGAIIDPVSKSEVQYSTPAFAAAAGLLVKEAGRKDLLEPASKALSCSLTALLAKKTANNHSDFYIPLILQAYSALREAAGAEAREGWEKQLQAVDPRTMYRADLSKMNWNLVSFTGEALRRKAGMVAPAQREDQQAYLEQSIAGHLEHLTKFGMYEDPGSPLAYDAFSRLWLEQALSEEAYEGALAPRLKAWLQTGGLSSLLLLSPTGEWASGGRSAFHQWNEAELAVICEIEATRWKAAGRADVAGAFKRAARLSLGSMKRWQRPSGEMWIVKNHAEPSQRFGFESYSSHSQYNLLPAAMLAAAFAHADESIEERATASETGGYVFDARETFHKVAAAAGGYYVLVDTAGDPHYNATGLQRVQRAGVAFSALSDSAAGDRAYGPNSAAKAAISPGIEWQGADGKWQSLVTFTHEERNLKDVVTEAALKVTETSPAAVAFSIEYTLGGAGQGAKMREEYRISGEGVEMRSRLSGSAAAKLRVRMPGLVSDGAAATQVTLGGGQATVAHGGSVLEWKLLGEAAAAEVTMDGAKTVTHQGAVQALMAELPAGTQEAAWRFTLAEKK
jgi:hypothetical protein